MTVLGQDRLRVKLHAFDRQRLVAQPHDFIDTTIGALRPRGNVEAIRQAILFNHQRVVARRLIRCRQALENACAGMMNRAGLAVHDRPRTNHRAAERLTDRLMAETDAENRERSEEHTSELQSLMRISYAVFCLKKKKINKTTNAANN